MGKANATSQSRFFKYESRLLNVYQHSTGLSLARYPRYLESKSRPSSCPRGVCSLVGCTDTKEITTQPLTSAMRSVVQACTWVDKSMRERVSVD